METEELHARPLPGEVVSPCCGRTLAQLPPYDRISPDPDQVTCGRLTAEDLLLLSGQPAVTDPAHEQALFAMASTVAELCDGTVSLRDALTCVDTAVREVVPAGVLPAWSASMMVDVTTRARQLLGH